MKSLRVILCLLLGMPALAQPTLTNIKRMPLVPGTSTMRDSAGYLVSTDYLGATKYLQTDVSAVRGSASYRSIAELRSTLLPTSVLPSVAVIIDKRREGTFVLDPTDVTTPDNGGTVLVDPLGRRWKRPYSGAINPEWFGARGTARMIPDTGSNHAQNVANAMANRIAIQAAVDWAAASSGAISDPTLFPNNKFRSAVVQLPSGTYLIDGAIYLKGAVVFKGEKGMSFGGTCMINYGSGFSLLVIAGSPGTGISSAVEINDIRLNLDPEFVNGISCIVIPHPAGSSYHSITIDGVWFQVPGGNQHSITILYGDDPKVQNCRFDGNENSYAVELGSLFPADVVSNAVFINNTFFNCDGGVIKAKNVDGLKLSENRIYNGTGHRTAYVVDALADTYSVNRLQINDNTISSANEILRTKYSNAQIKDNIITDASGIVLNLGGGGVISNIQWDNTVLGTFTQTAVYDSQTVPFSPVFARGTTLTNCRISGSIVDYSNTSHTAVYAPLAINCTIDADINGFATPYLIQNPQLNIFDRYALSRKDANLSDLTDKLAARRTLAASPVDETDNFDLMRTMRGFMSAQITGTFSTQNFSTTDYTQLVAPNTLAAGRVFLVKVRINVPGVDVFTQILTVPVEDSNSASGGTPPDLPYSIASYGLGSASSYWIRLRHKKPASGAGTLGLEAAVSNASLISSSGTLQLSITRLF